MDEYVVLPHEKRKEGNSEDMSARNRELAELYNYHSHSSSQSTGSHNTLDNDATSLLHAETTERTVSYKIETWEAEKHTSCLSLYNCTVFAQFLYVWYKLCSVELDLICSEVCVALANCGNS